MKIFYESYVRLMVWLGAAPPEGYEYLLPVEERMKMAATGPSSVTSTTVSTQEKSPVSAKTETTELNGEKYVVEEDLPEWMRGALDD